LWAEYGLFWEHGLCRGAQAVLESAGCAVERGWFRGAQAVPSAGCAKYRLCRVWASLSVGGAKWTVDR
jgi:hypothetical protein